ncbi:tyrosine-type recombinase/integrase [Streptomyces sp. NBC_01017]|uniref:tyrosine-type recombinase/integrase n=1 Tax=Streptomyces sp. NBC_01017 TaxID=2903721 RepID=UPI00386540A5|nr:tyrosine-type recombinase/integrase [Streptomyces sp. NBC_01017]WSV26651.1 tyrosine-type recombinase/integrase [Streptomyces sp. NBC_01017]WSV26901.1 tyrosine-type recombinase/integrase [Streptomyces sp. NBC_01017]WSV34777.1 tyrosine-type recombinase/integrase [Streptomyces sp. NBC_01017]WSV35026.1 tyrosine-type recombinase/integrase [Streptomyces sp. NBC_01017]
MTSLREHAGDYLTMRRNLGFTLEGHGRMLMDFISYLEGVGAITITTDLAVAWATRTAPGVNPASWNKRLTVARIFARHLQALDPATEIPHPDLMPLRYRRIAPHLFAPDEIVALMAAATGLRHPLRALNYATLIGLLAATGMRVGEACGLDRSDVDWDAGVLTIRAGKLGKAREVPVHPSTMQALHVHDQRRDLLQPVVSTPAFFVNTRGDRLDAHHVPETFARLRDAAGIRPAAGGRKPRIHDLRHTFCIATMLNWYRTGTDVQAQLPLLSTYLGHVDPVSTYWYLQAAPELLALAAGRLDAFLGDLP